MQEISAREAQKLSKENFEINEKLAFENLKGVIWKEIKIAIDNGALETDSISVKYYSKENRKKVGDYFKEFGYYFSYPYQEETTIKCHWSLAD